jgi:hypothetical protein
VLYTAFEAKRKLIVAGLHSEILERMREAAARTRWSAVRRIVDQYAPQTDPHRRQIAAANICFYLTASTWHYYRAYMRLSQEETIACADQVIRQALDGLKPGKS